MAMALISALWDHGCGESGLQTGTLEIPCHRNPNTTVLCTSMYHILILKKKTYLEKLDFCQKLSTFKATILHLHPTSDAKM